MAASSGSTGAVEQHQGRPSGVPRRAPRRTRHDRRGQTSRRPAPRRTARLPVQQQRPVGPGRLGDRVALHPGRPQAAVRVVLQRVEVADLAARPERDLGHLAGRPHGVGRERPEPLGLGVAPPAGGQHDGAGVDLQRPVGLRLSVARQPPAVGSSARSGAWSSVSMPSAAGRGPQRGGDRVAGAVADLQQPLAGRPAAAGQPVAAVAVAGELDAEAAEPLDRPGASPASTSTSRRLAVSCELAMMSAAWIETSSSSPNAAWIPPWAFAVFDDASPSLVASSTRAPASAAPSAACRPAPPEPITSTSWQRGHRRRRLARASHPSAAVDSPARRVDHAQRHRRDEPSLLATSARRRRPGRSG